MTQQVLTIARGPLSLGVCPDQGGCVTFFNRMNDHGQQHHVFAPADSGHPSNIILTPVNNRRFCVDSKGRQVGPQHGNEIGLNLHGDGWKSPWSVMEHGASHIVLAHQKDFSPAACDSYKATQELRFIDDSTLFMGVTVKNTGDRELVAGPAHHPWYDRDDQTRVRFDMPTDKVWLFDHGMRLDTDRLQPLPPSWAFNQQVRMTDAAHPTRQSVADQFLMDSCFPGVQAIEVIQPTSGLHIHMQTLFNHRPTEPGMIEAPLSQAVIYNPTRERGFLCAELVPSIPFAEHLMEKGVKDTGAVMLKPNESTRFDITVRVQPL